MNRELAEKITQILIEDAGDMTIEEMSFKTSANEHAIRDTVSKLVEQTIIKRGEPNWIDGKAQLTFAAIRDPFTGRYRHMADYSSLQSMDDTNPHQPGVKLDKLKPRPDLILDGFGLAILEVAMVAAFGADKYTEGGWETVPDGIKRYRAAGDRHRLTRKFQPLDPESNLMHLAHEAWNRLAELELALRAEHD